MIRCYAKMKIFRIKQLLSQFFLSACLPAKSEHKKSLKNSMPYSQTLKLRTTCSATAKYYKNLAFNKQKFLGKQYQEEDLN